MLLKEEMRRTMRLHGYEREQWNRHAREKTASGERGAAAYARKYVFTSLSNSLSLMPFMCTTEHQSSVFSGARLTRRYTARNQTFLICAYLAVAHMSISPRTRDLINYRLRPS